MDWSQRITFSFIFGAISTIGSSIIISSLVILNWSFLAPLNNIIGNSFLTLAVLSSFVLYICLALGSIKGKGGRVFLKLTLIYLWEFLMLISFSIFILVISIKSSNYFLLILWLIFDGILYFFSIRPYSRIFRKDN